MLQVLLDLRIPEKVDIMQFNVADCHKAKATNAIGQDAMIKMSNIVFGAMKFLLQGMVHRIKNSEDSDENLEDLKEINRVNKFLEEASKEPGKWVIEQSILCLLARRN
jgi:hypothetical protein